jgi:hypothetical protein
LKKEAKKFYLFGVAAGSANVPKVAKVFWLFFSKKNRFA